MGEKEPKKGRNRQVPKPDEVQEQLAEDRFLAILAHVTEEEFLHGVIPEDLEPRQADIIDAMQEYAEHYMERRFPRIGSSAIDLNKQMQENARDIAAVIGRASATRLITALRGGIDAYAATELGRHQ